jgi:hypothetical protein
MRHFAFAFICIVASDNCAFAQEENPFKDILKAPAELKIAEDDDKPTALRKQLYNAAHAEIRTRYNYWLQGVGEIDGLLDSVNRFHNVREEIEPKSDPRRNLEQKIAYFLELEKQSTTIQLTNAKLHAHREIDKREATSFRIAAQLELERLKKSASAN